LSGKPGAPEGEKKDKARFGSRVKPLDGRTDATILLSSLKFQEEARTLIAGEVDGAF